MIFLLSFGQNVLTGLLSLFIGTVGYLARAYAEAIDETAESSVEALHASGASWLQTVAQAVFPALMPRSRAGCCTCWRRTSGRRPWSAS